MKFIIAHDGSGDFRTVNEGLRALGDMRKSSIDSKEPLQKNNTQHMKSDTLHMESNSQHMKSDTEVDQLMIKAGIYEEQVEITLPCIELIGEDAQTTKITFGLYANMPSEDVGKLGTFRTYTLFVDANDVTLRNLTIENSAGPGKKVGQAIAAYIDGDRFTMEQCRLLGNQDTLFTGPLPPKEIEKNGFIGPKQHAPRINGRHYYKNCYIEGEVDFIFGSATCYFEHCDIFSKNINAPINGYVTAASTPEGQAYGYVFNGCNFISDCGERSVYLGRPWRHYAKTVIVNSYIGTHIVEEGWHDWNKTDARELVFYGEGGNHGEGASLVHRESWIRSVDPLAWDKATVLQGEDCWGDTL